MLFTETDLRARAWLMERMEAAGLAVRVDAVGNVFARWEGEEPDGPPVATGSHIDAIPDAGRFDGVVGVLGGLEAIRALRAAGVRPRRSIELIMFTAEEPTRFAFGCLGSRVLAGVASRRAARAPARRRRPVAGRGAHARPASRAPWPGRRLAAGAYAAFVELHIEQGPVLERAGVPIGVVTAIAAPSTLRVELSGRRRPRRGGADGRAPRPAGGGRGGGPGRGPGRPHERRRGHGRHGGHPQPWSPAP